MKNLAKLGLVAIAFVAFVKCGKKSDDSSSTEAAVPTLAVKCGEYACIGTEGK